MCQLLGMNANTPTDVMFSFTGLATRADEHKDGFGIAFFEDRGAAPVRRPRQSARASPVAEMVRRYPIKSDNVIAHIRKATQGRVALENCHPFQRELWGRYWVFAHNGDLKDFAPRLHAAFRPVGDTDSERAFCWLMQELAKAHAERADVGELTMTLARADAGRGRARHVQLLLSNGQALWALLLDAAWRGWCAGTRSRLARLRDEDLTRRFRAAHRAATASPSSPPSR